MRAAEAEGKADRLKRGKAENGVDERWVKEDGAFLRI